MTPPVFHQITANDTHLFALATDYSIWSLDLNTGQWSQVDGPGDELSAMQAAKTEGDIIDPDLDGESPASL